MDIAALRSRVLAALRRDLDFVSTMRRPKSVELTFDDGPLPEVTESILETLRARGITATFYLLGRSVAARPDLVQLIADQGHRIGNHSYTHPNLATLDEAAVRSEIVRTEDLIGPFLGPVKLFRPPYGARNAMVDSVVRELGYEMRLWNVSSKDWKPRHQPDGWVDHASRLVRFGGACTVLLHDLPTTASHLDAFVERLERLRVQM